MKKILLLIMTIIILLFSIVNTQAVSKTKYQSCSDNLEFFSNGKNNYIVSISGNKPVINLIGEGSTTITCNYEILKCQYSKGNFHLFYNNSDNKLCVVKYNYNDGSMYDIILNSSIKLNYKTASVDSDGYYYASSQIDGKKLLSFTKDGELYKKFSLDYNIIESDSINGNYIVLKSTGGIYYINSKSVYYLQDTYSDSPITMLNNDSFSLGDKIYSVIYDISYVNEINRTAIIDYGAVYAQGNTLYFTTTNMNSPSKKITLKNNINYLLGYGNKVFAVSDNYVYIVKYGEFTDIETTNNDTKGYKSIDANEYDDNDSTPKSYGISSDYFIFDSSYILDVPPSTTVSEFKYCIDYGDNELNIYEGKYYIPSGNVATGMTATFTGDTSISKTIIVNGDINCDGKTNSKDVNMMMEYLLGRTSLDKNSTLAGNLIRDNKIDNKDLVALAQLAN